MLPNYHPINSMTGMTPIAQPMPTHLGPPLAEGLKDMRTTKTPFSFSSVSFSGLVSKNFTEVRILEIGLKGIGI